VIVLPWGYDETLRRAMQQSGQLHRAAAIIRDPAGFFKNLQVKPWL